MKMGEHDRDRRQLRIAFEIPAHRGYAGSGIEYYQAFIGLKTEAGGVAAMSEDVATATRHAPSGSAYDEFVHDNTFLICSDIDVNHAVSQALVDKASDEAPGECQPW